MTGSPTPDLDHHGVGTGVECTLEHHPAPCDWEDDRRSVLCSFYADHVSVSEASSEEAPSAVQLLEERLAQLQREKEEESRRANLLQISNNNLRESQSQLHQQYSPHLGAYAPPTTSTTTSTTTMFSAPLMGTGFTCSCMAPLPSTGVYLSSSLASAASALGSRNNSAPTTSSSTIPGYGGPSLPEIRQDSQVNSFAQQVMSLLMREIPALASNPNVGAAALSGQGMGGLPPAPPHPYQPLQPQGPAQAGRTAATFLQPPPSSTYPLFGGPSSLSSDPALQ